MDSSHHRCQIFTQHAIERVGRPGGSHEGVGRKSFWVFLFVLVCFVFLLFSFLHGDSWWIMYRSFSVLFCMHFVVVTDVAIALIWWICKCNYLSSWINDLARCSWLFLLDPASFAFCFVSLLDGEAHIWLGICVSPFAVWICCFFCFDLTSWPQVSTSHPRSFSSPFSLLSHRFSCYTALSLLARSVLWLWVVVPWWLALCDLGDPGWGSLVSAYVASLSRRYGNVMFLFLYALFFFCQPLGGPFLRACFFLCFEVQKRAPSLSYCFASISIALRPSRPAAKPALTCFVLISMVLRHWSSRLALRPASNFVSSYNFFWFAAISITLRPWGLPWGRPFAPAAA